MTIPEKENFGGSVAPVEQENVPSKEKDAIINNFLAPATVVFEQRRERRKSDFLKKHRRPIAFLVAGLIVSIVILIALLLILTQKETLEETSAGNPDETANGSGDGHNDENDWNFIYYETQTLQTNKDTAVKSTVATPPPLSSADWQDGEVEGGKFRSAPRCDFKANDLLDLKSGCIEDCAEECTLTTDCSHFTWTGADNGGGVCWLKKGGDKYEETAFKTERIDAVCGYLTSRNNAATLDNDLTECQQYASSQLEQWCQCREEKGKKTLWLHESCFVLNVHRIHYDQAKVACTDKDGGHLAHPKSMADVDLLVQHGLISADAVRTTDVFVGIEQTGDEEPLGGWYYTHYDKNQTQVLDDAVVMDFKASDNLWAFNVNNVQEPNDADKIEDVGALFAKGLNDLPNTAPRQYICQYSAP